MYRMLLQIFCYINLIIIIRSDEYEVPNFNVNQPYDLSALFAKSFTRFRHSESLKDRSLSLVNNWQLNRQDKNFVFQPSGNLLRNSSKCLRDILYTLKSLGNQSNPWAMRLIDSFGKPPESGILQGNFKSVGDYNECIQVYAPHQAPNSTTENFRGKYCSLQWTLPIANFSIPFVFGVCIPDSCLPAELQEDILQLLHVAGSLSVLDETPSVSNKSHSLICAPTERHLNTPAKAVIALLSVFCAFTLLGSSVTAVKYFKKIIKEPEESVLVINISDKEHIIGDHNDIPNVESDDEDLLQDDVSESKTKGFLDKCQIFLSCFCLFTNGAKLLNTESSEGQLLCIHGIRFLSMSWVILGHTYAFCFLETRNIVEAMKIVDNFFFQVVLQGFFSVDSFFVLSGFLLTYLSMKDFSERKGGISWPYFYIHRYIRLTPIYMVVLGFSASVYFYLGSGPFWPSGDFDPICRKNWWWNLLYINNFNKVTEQCMGWSWYLANDMQFFVISPIFLISLWRWPKIGYSLLAVFLCASALCNFFITYDFDLFAGMIDFGNQPAGDTTQVMSKYLDYFAKLYIKPYTRIGPYLIGILVGYLLFKSKRSNWPKHSWITLCIGWIVASSVTLTCVYGLYHRHPPLIGSSIYNALSRTCFALGLSWVIYVCLTNQGGFVNSILSYKLFIPLSRLTYSAYLIHPLIISGYYASLRTTFEFSHPSVVVLYLGFMVVTYGLALPVSLVLESPIVSLEKLVRSSFNKVQKTGSNN